MKTKIIVTKPDGTECQRCGRDRDDKPYGVCSLYGKVFKRHLWLKQITKKPTGFYAMTDGEMVTQIFKNVFKITPEIAVVLKRMEYEINQLIKSRR